MAIYDVTGPDGRRYEVEGPPGATQAEVLARVQAHRMAQPKAKSRNPGSGVGFVDSLASTANELLIGGVEGLYNMGAAVTDPIMSGIFGKEAVNAARNQRARVSDAVSRATVSRPNPLARTTGQIASTIPLAKARVAGKLAQVAPRAAQVGTRAIQGAAGGAAVRDVGGDDAGSNMAIGAALNVALPPVLGVVADKLGGNRAVQWLGRQVSNAARPVVGAIDEAADDIYGYVAPKLGVNVRPQVDPSILARSAAPMGSAQSVAQPVRQTLGRQAQARMDDFSQLGIKEPTTAMVTRNPQAWTYERNTAKLSGLGDDLVAQFQKVDDGIEAAANKIVARRGGARNPEAVGEAVQEVLNTKRKEMQDVTSQLYTNVREQRGDTAAGTLDTFMDMLDADDFTDDPTLDAMREGVMRRLRRFGMAGDSGLIRKGAVVNVKQAEELRKFVGKLGNSADPNVRRVRASLIDALDDDVVAAVGDDAFKGARAKAKARFEEFGKTFAGRLADGQITSEKTVSRVLSGSNADLRALRESLSTGTPEQIARGQQVWNDIGAQAVDDFFNGARTATGLSPAKLAQQFKKNGAKLSEILTPEEFDQIARIVRVSGFANTAPKFSAVNNSNTASAFANMFAEAPGGKPGVGRSVMRNILQHVAAFAAVPNGLANIGLVVGKEAAGTVAASRAASEAARRVSLAQSPELAAAALKAAQDQASRDAARRALIKRWQDGGFLTPFQ